jgi:hypothetical protein
LKGGDSQPDLSAQQSRCGFDSQKTSALQAVMKRRKSIFPVMITTFGCEKNMHYLGLINHQLDLDDWFGSGGQALV